MLILLKLSNGIDLRFSAFDLYNDVITRLLVLGQNIDSPGVRARVNRHFVADDPRLYGKRRLGPVAYSGAT